MEAPSPFQNVCLKTIEIENEKNKYICKFQIIGKSIETIIFLADSSLYKGSIDLEKIQEKISTFNDYSINEILEEINLLDAANFQINKDSNQNILKIKFIILRKEKFLIVNLEEDKNMKLTNSDLVNYYNNIIEKKDSIILELKKIIDKQEEKIKLLKEQLKIKKVNKNQIQKPKEDETNKEKNYDSYNDFNIKLKEPIHKLNLHTGYVYCLAILNDGRLVSGSVDKSIIIYNKVTFQPDLIIKEHTGVVCCIIQLSSGELVSCSYDKQIKIFNIKGNEYEVLQTLKYHTNYVFKIIELKNKTLVSCSQDSSIIFYFKDNLEYKKDYQMSTNGSCSSVIQTKDNEICYSESNNNSIVFFDLLERKIKTSISNISKYNGCREWFIIMTKDLLVIPGENKISIINVNHYNVARIIEVPGSSWICGICILNENMILTGDYAEIIRQWRIEGDNLILVSKKEKTHDKDINVLLNLGNGQIASGSDDHSIKIW